jgi:hypothetical protein
VNVFEGAERKISKSEVNVLSRSKVNIEKSNEYNLFLKYLKIIII